MQRFWTTRVCLASAVLCILASRCCCQDAQGETLSGPDSHETGQGAHGHLFGDWGGERSRLFERGVRFDLQYISDSLWNLKSEQPERFASWNRFRWTVDIDFGALTGQRARPLSVAIPGTLSRVTNKLWTRSLGGRSPVGGCHET